MNKSKFVQNTAMITIVGAILALVGTFSYSADPSLAYVTTRFGLMTCILMAAGFAMVTTELFGLWQSGGLLRDSGLAKIGFGMSVIGQLLVILYALMANDTLSIVTAVIIMAQVCPHTLRTKPIIRHLPLSPCSKYYS